MSNRLLKHTAGGPTTRDGNDSGVPMLPGSPREKVGPEDAFGEGPKRGDYTGRVSTAVASYTVEQGPDGTLRRVHQNPRARQIGDVFGLKGGVDTGETR